MPVTHEILRSPVEHEYNPNYPTLIGTVQVTSNKPVHLSCGLYESSMPEPRFKLDVFPKPDYSEYFVASLKRIEGNGEYELVYFFDNYGGPDYTVSVWSSDNSSERAR